MQCSGSELRVGAARFQSCVCLRRLCNATARAPSVALPDLDASGLYLIKTHEHDPPAGLQLGINALGNGLCTCALSITDAMMLQTRC